jgi:hypothetical protein
MKQFKMKTLSRITATIVLLVTVAMQQPKQNNSASAEKNKLYKGTGKATFFSVAPIQNIDAVSYELKSELNTQTNDIAFKIPMRSFQFKNGKMQTDFNEDYLESDKYPDATYKGKIQGKIDWTHPGTYKAVSKGVLTIHNVSKERTDTATVTVSNGKINIKGDFSVRIADHQIRIPTLVVKKIAEIVTVKFDEQYEAKAD